MFTEKRYGRFEISDEIIREDKNLVMDIMSKCIVFRAEHLVHKGTIEYYAYSDSFDLVPQGNVIPYYGISFHDGQFKFNKEL